MLLYLGECSVSCYSVAIHHAESLAIENKILTFYNLPARPIVTFIHNVELIHTDPLEHMYRSSTRSCCRTSSSLGQYSWCF